MNTHARMFGHLLRVFALAVAMVGILTDEPIQVSFSIFLMMAATAVDALQPTTFTREQK